MIRMFSWLIYLFSCKSASVVCFHVCMLHALLRFYEVTEYVVFVRWHPTIYKPLQLKTCLGGLF